MLATTRIVGGIGVQHTEHGHGPTRQSWGKPPVAAGSSVAQDDHRRLLVRQSPGSRLAHRREIVGISLAMAAWPIGSGLPPLLKSMARDPHLTRAHPGSFGGPCGPIMAHRVSWCSPPEHVDWPRTASLTRGNTCRPTCPAALCMTSLNDHQLSIPPACESVNTAVARGDARERVTRIELA
jgi:hypothetical protein